MLNIDRDPLGSEVLRSVAQERGLVLIIVCLVAYESLIGAPVDGPLLQDGIELTRAIG